MKKETETGRFEPLKTLFSVRSACESDLGAINDIYNHYVLHSTCTYQEEPEPLEGRQRWFHHHGDKYPVIVALTADDQVAGWGSLSPFHERSAYRRTVENSIYIHPQYHRRGIGSLIMGELITRASSLGYKVIIAGIDGDQAASIALHTKFNFEKVGHLKRVGFKFGRLLDVIHMELCL